MLLARAARARDALPEALRRPGAQVDVVAAYETHPAPPERFEAPGPASSRQGASTR